MTALIFGILGLTLLPGIGSVVAGICYLVAALWSLNALKVGLVVWAVLAALGFRLFGRER